MVRPRLRSVRIDRQGVKKYTEWGTPSRTWLLVVADAPFNGNGHNLARVVGLEETSPPSVSLPGVLTSTSTSSTSVVCGLLCPVIVLGRPTRQADAMRELGDVYLFK